MRRAIRRVTARFAGRLRRPACSRGPTEPQFRLKRSVVLLVGDAFEVWLPRQQHTGGTGVVSHVGAALLRLLANRAGLTDALSGALVRAGRWPTHERGRVLADLDLAVMIADGGEAICDIEVLRHQHGVFGPVPSGTTAWRALDGIGSRNCGASPRLRPRQARMWQLFGGPPRARAAGRDIGDAPVVPDADSTIVIAHSDKDGAAAAYKHTLGFHPARGLRQHRRVAGRQAAGG